MASDTPLVLEDLRVTAGTFALRGISLQVRADEYLVLLGPTGCGKTVLLETLVGLHRPDEGRILIGGTDAGHLPPERRHLGFVPQDYALFPTMTVRENLAFGPSMRGWAPSTTTERVDELMGMLGIAHLANRLPGRLSGGEKQRVAVGRALAARPRTLILDEPLSALDAGRRTELAAELRRIQRLVKGSFLHVCHDLDEALQVADRMVLMRDGRFEQVGPPDDLLQRPATKFVARFTGTPNVFPIRSRNGDSVTLEDGTTLCCPPSSGDGAPGACVAVRPDAMRLTDGTGSGERESADAATCLPATLVAVTRRALAVEARVRVGPAGSEWVVLLPSRHHMQVGAPVHLWVPPSAVWMVPA